MKNTNDKIDNNLDLMDELRNYTESEGFVIVYIVDETQKSNEDLNNSYYINAQNEKVNGLWEAKIFKTEDEAIFASRSVSFGEAVTSTVISPACIFVYDAIEKLKEINVKLQKSLEKVT